MTRAVPYYHVDAFAERPFAGNQAAVVELGGWPEDATLQAIAAENMFAETAFLAPDPDGRATRALRWFTPAVEVALCGHATLASGHVLLGLDPDAAAVTFATRASGTLEVRRLEEGYELALPTFATEPRDWAEAASALGMAPQETRHSPRGYAVFAYRTADEVRALAPDFAALKTLGDYTMIATAPGDGGSDDDDVVSRVFVPFAGIDEDSVTGAAHAVLTPFWAARLGRRRFTACQASARGGRLTCRLDGERAWLGGRCVTVVEGRFYL